MSRQKIDRLLSLKTLIGLLVCCSFSLNAQNIRDVCLLETLKKGPEDMTIADIKDKCDAIYKKNIKTGAISKRIISERISAFDPYVITPHKMNYILPVSFTNQLNDKQYSNFGDWQENLEDIEAKFQLSIKVPLLSDSLFIPGDSLHFGFTLQSWWQLYSNNISKPFRETNYQPEIFYMAPLDWHPFDSNTGLMIGAEHQSNGRSQLLSRSWNRVYLNFLYEKDNFAFSFKPWIRIPEKDKENALSSDGDDNPDIGDYMGHFELGMVYKWSDYELSLKGRENFSKHHGGLEFGFTFPLWGKLRGYAQYTAGYGESLIDYNHKQQRFGLGIALTNVL
ncbi:MAG: phospholipase A [Colwelliaceae bacterium]|jgi:phospholipase A1|nr:phospholipase A [Colwelliaceae bacterium]